MGFIETMFAAPTIETRATKIDPVHPRDPGIISIFNLDQSDETAGVAVTPTTAISGTTFLQAVRIVGEGMGMLPFLIYKRKSDSDEGKERFRKHPLTKIFRFGPNEFQTKAEFMERMFAQAMVYGRSYAEIEWRTGNVERMWQIPHSWVTVHVKNNRRWFVIDFPDGKPEALREDQMFQLNGFNLGGYRGLNLLNVGREALGHDLALRKFGSSFFSRGALQRGFIKVKGRLSADRSKEIEKQILEKTQGLDRAHRMMVLGDEASWENTGIEPEHAQWIAARKFSVVEIARLTNVKPHLLMDLERATFSNISEQGEEHVRYTLGPWSNRFEERVLKSLVPPREQDDVFGEFLMEALLKGNTKDRYEAYNIGIQAGFLLRNEVRTRENLNPIDGLDTPLQPLNMVAAGEEAPTPDGDPSTVGGDVQEDSGTQARSMDRTGSESRPTFETRAKSRKTLRESHKASFRAAAERLVKREVREIRKKLKLLPEAAPDAVIVEPDAQPRAAVPHAIETRDVSQFMVWLDEFYEDFPEVIRKEMRPAVAALMQSVAAQVAGELGVDDIAEMEDQIKAFVEGFSERYAGSSAGQIRQLIKDGALAEGINDRLGEWIDKRADKIANRDTVQAEGYAAREAMRSGGVTKIRWVAVGESCPICNEIDGKVVGVEEAFASAGDVINPNMEGQDRETDVPISLKVSGNVFHPPLHDGCDCVVVAE